MNKKDPTKTLTARNKVTSKLNGKFNELRRVTSKYLLDNLLYSKPPKHKPGQFVYTREVKTLNEFSKWFKGKIASILTPGSTPKSNFILSYIKYSYFKGVARTLTAAKMGKSNFEKSLLDIYSDKEHIRRAALLYTRVYSELEGVGATTSERLSRTLSSGMIEGLNPKIVAKNISKEVKSIGNTRAVLIARTEMVNANNVGSIQELEHLNSYIDEVPKVLWVTAIDGRERKEHREWNKKVFTTVEAMSMIGAPNCRCATTPWFEGFTIK